MLLSSPSSGNEELVDHRKPEWFHIDRVISLRKKDNIAEKCQILPSFQASQHQNEDFEYLTKWKGLDYCEATWESTLTEDLLAAVSNLFQRHTKTSERCNNDHLNTSVCHFDETPGYLSGMLYPYQLVGLNWLLRSFLARRNVILAGMTLPFLLFKIFFNSRWRNIVIYQLKILCICNFV